MSKIDLNNISHTYNPNDSEPTYALNPFSMTWENGKRYAILGPSGCGKTTMLRSEERRVGKECRSRWSPYH